MAPWSDQIRRRFGRRVEPCRPVGVEGRLVADELLSRWCRDACRTLGLGILADRVKVGWNSRLQTTAGRAWWPDAVVELNPKLKEAGDEELWRTLRHELAHLVAHERSGRRKILAHGKEWRQACMELGIPGEKATHRLAFGARKLKRKFAYACGHCQATVERVRRMRGQAACYHCCRNYAGGRFDERFLLVERKL